MSEYNNSIETIFDDIRTFIIDYVKLFRMIHHHSQGNLMSMKLGKEEFYFPATLTEFSQRASQLQYRLQRQIRCLAQKRRHDISKGIEHHEKHDFIKQKSRFDQEFQTRLEHMPRIQIIIDAIELYDELQTNKSFRLLPILHHIQKQFCCISNEIQKILDHHTLIIAQHLRKLQAKLFAYDEDMKKKLAEYISRDIRPPVLIIPCPSNTPSTSNY